MTQLSCMYFDHFQKCRVEIWDLKEPAGKINTIGIDQAPCFLPGCFARFKVLTYMNEFHCQHQLPCDSQYSQRMFDFQLSQRMNTIELRNFSSLHLFPGCHSTRFFYRHLTTFDGLSTNPPYCSGLPRSPPMLSSRFHCRT